MLFAIKDELNATILRFTDGYAMVDFFDSGQQEPWISLNFVQAKQVKGGIIISYGYDPDFPNKTMRFISGEMVIEQSTQTITAIDKRGLKAFIRKAERDERSGIERYLGLDAEEGRRTIDKHIESFIAACKDWDTYYVEDEQ
jgi:hypothetical protein